MAEPQPEAGFPGCTNSGACKSDIEVIGLPSPIRRATVPLIGTGATADETGRPPVRPDFDINLSQPGEIQLFWTDAVFVQETKIFGQIWLRLSPSRASENALMSVSSAQESFFPARSRTTFYWQLELPRFGWKLENRAPMVTESLEPHLLSYPVQHAWYSVPEPVEFGFVQARGPHPRALIVGTSAPVTFGPFSRFLTGAGRVVGADGDRFRIRITVDPYNLALGPRRLRVAWYLRDSDAGGDPEHPTRGIVDLLRGSPTTFETKWRRAAYQHVNGAALTLVLLSLDPAVPGHAEIPITLPT